MKTVLIEGSDNYLAREDGKIIGKTGTVLKENTTTGGYLCVSVKIDGKFVTKRVHRLIAETFLDNPLNLPEINHKDGDKTNNAVSNLEWVTSSENKRHSVDVLGNNRGEDHHYATITEDLVHTVCKLLCSGYQNKFISDKTGVSRDIVLKIRKGRNWKHISKDYNFPSKSSALSEETVRWVCHQYEAGKTPRQVFEETTNDKLTLQVLRGIKERRNYKAISKDFNF